MISQLIQSHRFTANHTMFTIYVYIDVYIIHIYIYAYVCIYIYVGIYIYMDGWMDKLIEMDQI